MKKNHSWHFGYKAQISVDKDSGLAHTVKVTSANVHDVTMTSALLSGEKAVIYGDSGYLGASKREDTLIKNRDGKKIQYKINLRPSQLQKGSTRSKWQRRRREREEFSIRSKVEQVFSVVKMQLKYRKHDIAVCFRRPLSLSKKSPYEGPFWYNRSR